MRILALDDDAAYRELYRDFFGMQPGVELAAASTVAEAIALLEAGSFDLVLTDVFLGGGGPDGRDLVRWLHERGRPEAVVVVSGSTSSAVDEELMSLGVVRSFGKPFSLVALWTFIRGAARPSAFTPAGPKD